MCDAPPLLPSKEWTQTHADSVIAVLSSGTYGRVSVVRAPDDRRVAVKEYLRVDHDVTQHGLPEDEVREISVMRRLQTSEHIVPLVGVFLDASQPSCDCSLHIVMDVMDRTLHEEIRTVSLDADARADFALHVHAQLTRGILYVHEHGFMHRDLKPRNLFCRGSPGHATIVIGDFGLSVAYVPGRSYTKFNVQTIGYRAPEVQMYATQTPVIDYWSIGVIVAEAMGGTPFFSIGPDETDSKYQMRLLKAYGITSGKNEIELMVERLLEDVTDLQVRHRLRRVILVAIEWKDADRRLVSVDGTDDLTWNPQYLPLRRPQTLIVAPSEERTMVIRLVWKQWLFRWDDWSECALHFLRGVALADAYTSHVLKTPLTVQVLEAAVVLMHVYAGLAIDLDDDITNYEIDVQCALLQCMQHPRHTVLDDFYSLDESVCPSTEPAMVVAAIRSCMHTPNADAATVHTEATRLTRAHDDLRAALEELKLVNTSLLDASRSQDNLELMRVRTSRRMPALRKMARRM